MDVRGFVVVVLLCSVCDGLNGIDRFFCISFAFNLFLFCSVFFLSFFFFFRSSEFLLTLYIYIYIYIIFVLASVTLVRTSFATSLLIKRRNDV